jgi:hypothetical protein
MAGKQPTHPADVDPERWEKVIVEPLDEFLRETAKDEPNFTAMRALTVRLLLAITEYREEGWR